MLRSFIAPVAALAALLVLPAAADAQAAPDFYKGRTVTLYVGSSVGGAYDAYGRMVARFIGRHIPGNPTIVVENMEGAAGLQLANWLAQGAPKDGTVFGIISHAIPFVPLLGLPGAVFKGTDFAWLGSASNDVSVCVAWKTSPVKTFADSFTDGAYRRRDRRGKQRHGAVPAHSEWGARHKIKDHPRLSRRQRDRSRHGARRGRGALRLRVVGPRLDPLRLDQEQGRQCAGAGALEKHKDLPDTPLVTDFAKTDAQHQILKLNFASLTMFWPFLAPSGTTPDRVAILRKAFMETMSDPDFLAECGKARLEINALPGDKVEALVKEIYQTPPDIVKQAAAMLN